MRNCEINRPFIKVLLICVLLSRGFVFALAQDKKKPEFATYQEMRALVVKLYEQKEYARAAAILESALDQFPDYVHANTYNLALMYVQLNKYTNALKALEYGLEHDIWYGKYDFSREIWAPLKSLDEFANFVRRNDAKKTEAQKSALPGLDVLVPEDFDENRKYPLFIALHGGGENIEVFKPRWISNLLRTEFIVAYPQSSQIVSMNGYSWTEDLEIAKREILRAYGMVLKDYPVDTTNVIVGGFSSGGVAALEIVLNDVVPVTGFVVLCPARPDDFTTAKVQETMERGVRGTLMTTEMDPRLKDQKQMATVMDAQGFPYRFIVTPDIGHWYPEDLDKMIDAVIVHIRELESRSPGEI